MKEGRPLYIHPPFFSPLSLSSQIILPFIPMFSLFSPFCLFSFTSLMFPLFSLNSSYIFSSVIILVPFPLPLPSLSSLAHSTISTSLLPYIYQSLFFNIFLLTSSLRSIPSSLPFLSSLIVSVSFLTVYFFIYLLSYPFLHSILIPSIPPSFLPF